MKYPCYIEFSSSGKLAMLVHKNQIVMAKLVIHGPFKEICELIHTHQVGRDATASPTPFKAEVFGLANYETIESHTESVKET